MSMHGCHRCSGEGEILVCIDDMCRGAGECMHGDGYRTCPDCKGEGEIYDDDFYDEDPLAQESQP